MICQTKPINYWVLHNLSNLLLKLIFNLINNKSDSITWYVRLNLLIIESQTTYQNLLLKLILNLINNKSDSIIHHMICQTKPINYWVLHNLSNLLLKLIFSLINNKSDFITWYVKLNLSTIESDTTYQIYY